MIIKNAYEARLAKLAGNDEVNIPRPQNAYQKYLDDISGQSGGGDGSCDCLPEVTAADDGAVLTVVDGAWAKAVPAGGSASTLLVTATVATDSESGNVTATFDYTAGEILDALEAGKVVYVSMSGDGGASVISLLQGVVSEGESYSFTAASMEFVCAGLQEYPSMITENSTPVT